MLHQSKSADSSTANFMHDTAGNNEIINIAGNVDALKDMLQLYQLPGVQDIIGKLGVPAGKKSFLVFKNNKYRNIRTENIAYFYVRYDNTIIVTSDNQEYTVNHSLEHVQSMLPEKQFFRINRQYLVSFNAVKESEYYFARKLLVNLTITTREKLIVSKERVSDFLNWLSNR